MPGGFEAVGRFGRLDVGIISHLLADPRMPVARLARALGTSEHVTAQGLDRLLASGDVRVVALVDPVLLGRPVTAFLTVSAADPALAATALAAQEDVHWVTTTANLTVVLAQASTASNDSLLEFVNAVVRCIPGVRTVTVDIGIRAFATSSNFGGVIRPVGTAEKADAAPWAGLPPSGRELDEVDRAVLQHLQRDGRASLTALSAVTGLSVPATRQRFLKLGGEGLLRIQCMPDLTALGMASGASARFVVDADSQVVARRIARTVPEANHVFEVAGRFNIHANLACRDDEAMAACFARLCDEPGVASAELFPYRRRYKWTARWA